MEAAAPDLTRGLQAWLKLDETTGLAAADASGKNHPGALEGFADDNSQWQAGEFNGAVSFSASNPDSTEVVTIADDGTLDFSAGGAFTASCWVKAEAGAVQKDGAGILCKGGGGGGEQFGGAEAITLDQAIRMFTLNAARELGEEQHLGSLEVGKLADFIVLDRNPFQIPVTELHSVVVQKAYVGGREVFTR